MALKHEQVDFRVISGRSDTGGEQGGRLKEVFVPNAGQFLVSPSHIWIGGNIFNYICKNAGYDYYTKLGEVYPFSVFDKC